MRYYKQYRFQVGRKIEFKDLFSCIDAFLKDQEIHYSCLGYDLLSLDNNCYKLVQKMPQLGPIVCIEGPYNTLHRLSNMTSAAHPCDEASIRLAGAKIPRPYNFFYTHFYYRNVSFLGSNPVEEQISEMPNGYFLDVPGSYIELFRDFVGPQTTAVNMKIEVTDAQTCLQADEYARKMAAHLGNVKYAEGLTIYMSPTEDQLYKNIKKSASPIVRNAKEELNGLPEQVRDQLVREFSQFEEKSFQISPIMRRAGKKYGFDQFVRFPDGSSYIGKSVNGGNYLAVEFYGTPGSGFEADLILCGPGFRYEIANFCGCPANPDEARWHLDHMLALAGCFEEKYMEQILDLYPQSPDWLPMCLDS